MNPVIILGALMLSMVVVTNFVSNNAAAIVGTPVAFVMATTLGVDPRPFVLAVLFGCNLSYATPHAVALHEPAGRLERVDAGDAEHRRLLRQLLDPEAAG